MALNIAAPVLSDSKLTRNAPNRTPADRGPNLFLDNGWLQQSYEQEATMDVVADGTFEEYTMKKGAHKGEPATRLTGDAQEVTRQLREAAKALGIGVAIKYFPVVHRGKEVKGKVLVKYLGTVRKAERKPKATATEPTATEAVA